MALTVGAGQPGRRLVGVDVPEMATQGAEIGGTRYPPEEAQQLADDVLERQLAGGQRREALAQVVLHLMPHQRAATLVGAGVELIDAIFHRQA